MSDIEKIQLFEGRKVRSLWKEEEEAWYFVVEDVVSVLTDSADPKQYVKRMKLRDKELAKGWVHFVPTLPIMTKGGVQKMNCSTMEGIFRIIQSIPSKKAEPFKQWMAQVAAERVNQMVDPERSIDQAMEDYRRLGYSEAWINQRIKTIEIRKHLTDEWKRGGVTQEVDFAFLTDLMSKTWSGLTTREYKKHKGLKQQSLRDNMTDVELMLSGLAEASATAISKESDPQGMGENAVVAAKGANIAKNARLELEAELGHTVITSENALGHTVPEEQLPFDVPKQIGEKPEEGTF